MSYTALYRKFRPANFENIWGQEHIVTTLKNQIKANRIGHAYLFCGTRGTGKTTISKIFAKAVNCSQPRDGSPCGECEMCKAIKAQTSMNVIEIDAASNNGVDNIREIVDEVKYSPTEGKYKVYIIDEVHMLSAGAFNALLKTLEEPPAYVIFILATTEVHKIPVTILSRCQRYDFKRITIDQITGCLHGLIEEEGIEAEEKALRYIARMADGALRDALSLLDQCISFYLGQTLTYDNVLQVLGTVDIEIFSDLLQAIKSNDVNSCISVLERLITAGRDLTQFTLDFTWYLRNLVLLKLSPDAENILEVSSDQLSFMKKETEGCDAEIMLRYIRIFSELSNQMKFAVQKRILLEIAIIKLCYPSMETDYSSLTQRIKRLEEMFEQGLAVVPPSVQDIPKKQVEKEETKTVTILPSAVSKDLQAIAEAWNSIVSMTPPLVKTVLYNTVPSSGPDNSLLLLCKNPVDKEVIDKPEHLEDIKKAIGKAIYCDVNIIVKQITGENDQSSEPLDLSKIFKDVPIDYLD